MDDEPSILEGLRDTLRRHFIVEAVTSGTEGLALLRREARRFAVVISDMRMPEMSGSVFLGKVRRVAPLATRMLLTGHSDVESAIRAVNEGQVFRFLGKPCVPDELLDACAAAVWQHRLLATERALADETLKGCVQALTEVVALASPEAFGRGTRARAMISRFASDLGMQEAWELEVAAVLAHLGALRLPAATADKLYTGGLPTTAGTEDAARAPAVSERVLHAIPRLEGVLQIIASYQRRFDSIERDGLLPLGARVMRIIFDYDDLATGGHSGAAALEAMASREGTYDPELLAVFARGIADTGSSARPGETAAPRL